MLVVGEREKSGSTLASLAVSVGRLVLRNFSPRRFVHNGRFFSFLADLTFAVAKKWPKNDTFSISMINGHAYSGS